MTSTKGQAKKMAYHPTKKVNKAEQPTYLSKKNSEAIYLLVKKTRKGGGMNVFYTG